MKILMLCREPRLYSCQRLKAACEARGFELDILDPNRMLLRLSMVSGKPIFQVYYQTGESYQRERPEPELLPEYAAVIPRFGTVSTVMGCNVLRHYESQGVPVLNRTAAFLLARDKWQSLQALVAANVPVPETALTGKLFSVSSAIAQENMPLVVKTLSGSQGVGVMLMESQSSAVSLLETLHQANVSTLQQAFIAESKGQDIRAFVIGDSVVAAMQRSSANEEFRANIHLGGSAQAIQLSEVEQQLAVQAAKAIGLEVTGVDLIRSHQDLIVLEVNASPGLEGIENASGVDIADLMIAHLVQKLA